MRWDNLTIDAERDRTLPGYRDPAVVRRFDAPQALDTRFYEVRAKSALNRVPAQSRMPFRWTINPYRGCSHACVYCADGETPILMADGRTRPLGELQVGDRIYGTERRGDYRRYTPTTVLARWETSKPAHRVGLEDGTDLIASGDHRFLSDRGWKFVTGAEQGALRRPHLTLNNALLGTGRLGEAPVHCPEYRRGYLCGLIRGDGHIGTYCYDRPGRSRGDVHRFRLALADTEALWRARDFLASFGVPTHDFAFSAANERHRAVTAIRCQARESVQRVRDLIAWCPGASQQWWRGFLGGIFDAEGSSGRGIVRIANQDPEIIGRTLEGLRRLGFTAVVEPETSTGCFNVRLLGGTAQHLQFFQLVDSAITRKRTIDDRAIKFATKLGVVEIEPLSGTRDLVDITTGTGDFIANGVVSHNCFARPTHTYLGFDADRDFEREIVVKVNLPEVLRAELARPSWKREHVALGTNTDPYQWVEGRYRLMPGVWTALRDSRTPCSVLTKSPLLLRDLDLMRELSERVGFTANLSIPTLDEKAWRATEPHTPHPRKRLEAIAELSRAGISTGVLIAPLMPGINDSPAQVERIIELATEAGAGSIGGVALHLRGEVRGIFFDWLRSQRPDLIQRYERLYARGAYMPAPARDRLSKLARRRDGGWRESFRGSRAPAREAAPKAPVQEALF